ncbi:Zinc finger protein [Giardia duodenalis]|uniref:Zinc finger protein n=1 Tax=Giardia intestinalis TaxID=5741 RepID=V6TIP5_GIAIN|nr:Zinc finger protein [Giardia intestinalis]
MPERRGVLQQNCPGNWNGATIAIASLFRLKDPSHGFLEANRIYLREVPILAVSDAEKEAYEDSLSTIEPMVPFNLYDSSKSYAEMRMELRATRHQFFDPLQNFLPFMAYDLFDMMPEKTLSYFERVEQINAAMLSSEPSLVEIAGLSDDYNAKYSVTRDYGYKNRCCGDVLAAREREHPFVYGQYRLEAAPGCQHYWRACSSVCSTCKSNGAKKFAFPCHFCHDLEVDHHTLSSKDVKEVICWTCQQCGPIGEVCVNCGAALTTRYCATCKILSLMPLDYETFVHCDHCDRCVSVHEHENHYCARGGDAEDCPICLLPLNTDLSTVKLSCSAGHFLHASCYDRVNEEVESGEKCPLDGMIVGERDSYYCITAYAHAYFREHVFSWTSYKTIVIVSCVDCGKLAFNLYLGADDMQFSHCCFGCNTIELKRITMPSDLVETLVASIPWWLSQSSCTAMSASSFSLYTRADYPNYSESTLVMQFVAETEWLIYTHPILFTSISPHNPSAST